jgi:hypothetical protein
MKISPGFLLTLASAFTPNAFPPYGQRPICRPAIDLQMTAQEPTAPAQIGKGTAEFLSSSPAHPHQVGKVVTRLLSQINNKRMTIVNIVAYSKSLLIFAADGKL